mgnify:CR=1 FL=1
MKDLPKAIKSVNGKEQGKVVGQGFLCRLESCGGWRVPVRWPDGKLTYPCTKGMKEVSPGVQQIEG